MIIILLEILGTIAFAVVGASIALERHLDVFGVLIVSVVSATGGGILRDIILGNVPPVTFRNPTNIIAALLGCLVIIVAFKRNRALSTSEAIRKTVDVFDTIGLAVFTINGIDTALAFNPEHGVFLLSFVGVITAVGGGVIRDVLVGRIPFVLKRDIYATASIIGSVAYIAACIILPREFARWGAIIIIILVRLCCLQKNGICQCS